MCDKYIEFLILKDIKDTTLLLRCFYSKFTPNIQIIPAKNNNRLGDYP